MYFESMTHEELADEGFRLGKEYKRPGLEAAAWNLQDSIDAERGSQDKADIVIKLLKEL